MNWRRNSVLVAVLAAFLSIVMVTPAAAAGEWTPEPDKFNPETRYKYGYDYYKKEMIDGKAWTYKVGDKIPVPSSVNPSNTGGSWYLNNQKNARALPPSDVPLSGKIIEPGKTVVRPPSTYAPTTKFASGLLGASRLLGGIGVGMGGTALAPANAQEIGLAQGVAPSCYNKSSYSCSSADIDKIFLINSCGQLSGANSCASIGAQGVAGETDLQKWFRQDVIPIIDDIWAQLTGQKKSALTSDSHVDLTGVLGCYRWAQFEHTGGNTGKLHWFGEIAAPKPASGSAMNAWNSFCSNLSVQSNANMQVTTECVDTTGNFRNPTNLTVGYGRTLANASMFDTVTNLSRTEMCSPTAPTGTKLVSVRMWNNTTQAAFDTSGTMRYTATRYTEWINPDLGIDAIDDTKITTSWDCRKENGSIFTLTRTVPKTAALPLPQCPMGSFLSKHETKATDAAGGNPRTIDAGQEDPTAAAKYPLCLTGNSSGCALSVDLDGQPCTTTRPDCQNWPAVAGISPSRVQCKYGTYVAPVTDCYAISNGYKTETGVVFEPKSQTWVAIDAYGQPVAPNPQPWNPTNPNPVIGSSPGTATPTTPGTGTGTPGFPTTGTAPATDNCSAPSWSWNPVEWVKNPVVCALVDTFVPKTDVAARMTTIQTLATTHPPFSWFTPVMLGPGGSGCPDWNIVIPGVMSKNVVCESSFTAAIVGARSPMFTLLSAAMVWPLIRSLWYAAIPILRVTPSSGGK